MIRSSKLVFQSVIEPVLEISKLRIKEAGIKLSIHSDYEDIQLFGNEIQLSPEL